MQTILEAIITMSFTLSIPLVNIFYGVLDNSKRGAYSIATGIGRATPFLKIFIIPYIGWYPFIILTLLFFYMKDRRTYLKTLISLRLVMSIDNKLLQIISIRFRNGVLDRVMPFITWCNNYGQVYLLFALYESIIRHNSQIGKTIILALIIEVVICELIVKQIFRRTRPILEKKEEFKCLIKVPESYSFPSGHTASSFAVVSVVWSMNSNYKYYILIFAVLVSLSRIYLRVHYPTDVTAAIVLGLCTGKLAACIPNYYAVLETYCDQHSIILLNLIVPLMISIIFSVLFYRCLKMNLEV